MTAKEAYVDLMRGRLDRWDARLEALLQRLGAAAADDDPLRASQPYHALRQARSAFRSKLRSFEGADPDTWRLIKEEAEQAWTSLEQQWLAQGPLLARAARRADAQRADRPGGRLEAAPPSLHRSAV